ncbi:MAG: FAD-dependent monooxygenase, partial [Bacteroidota bacterium]
MRGSHKRILVIGAGPAGLASAIFLRQIEGLAVDVVTHRPHHESLAPYHIGESLPPQAARVLKQLGVWDSFQQSVHLPSYGNISFGGLPEGFLDCIRFTKKSRGHSTS